MKKLIVRLPLAAAALGLVAATPSTPPESTSDSSASADATGAPTHSRPSVYQTVYTPVVDPDPELFDGSKFKKPESKEDQTQSVDKWEDANLIVIDSNEEGSAEGGQGLTGYDRPGYDQGVEGGSGRGPGLTAGGGLPIPSMGGAPSEVGIGEPGMGIPLPMGSSGGTSDGAPNMAMGMPGSGESTDLGGAGGMSAEELGVPNAQKPGDVSIGDPSQQIKQTASAATDLPGETDVPEGGEKAEGKGQDGTTVPKSAAGAQTGRRSGGVEKGDAMPSEL